MIFLRSHHLRPTLTIARARARQPITGVSSNASNISFQIPKQRSSFTTTKKATSPGGGGGGGNSSGGGPRTFYEICIELRGSPLQYATIPAVAAFLGLYTNWVGVKMLFYPIEYTGTEWYVSKIQQPSAILSSCYVLSHRASLFTILFQV